MISRELSATLGFAVREAKKRRHEYVCIEHVLFAILHDPTGIDIIESCGGDTIELKSKVDAFLQEKIERLDGAEDYVLQQTLGFQRVIQRAVSHVRSAEKKEVEVGDVIASIFQERDSHASYFLETEGVTRLSVLRYISHEHEQKQTPAGDGQSGPEGGDSREDKEETDPLNLYTVDLVERALEGRLDPLIGRTRELQRIIQVLLRRRKNNPIFVGDPGVGKTALAEGLAQMVASGVVPEPLRDTKIYSLDLPAVLAGTKFRGDFEKRMKGVIESLKAIPNVILYIDEIHTVVGAGATSSGSIDASNMLKPVLGNGELRCMGSTTYEEYKNNFEKDRALSRRFEKIDIREPSVAETVEILNGLKDRFESHHQVIYTPAALEAAADLSFKHINDRYLPDKAIDVIDEAGVLKRLDEEDTTRKVRVADMEKVVAVIAKIPARSVSRSDRDRLKTLGKRMKRAIFGQDEALDGLITAIKRSRAGLSIPDKPIGSFLFSGPTGVGKTEVAKQLALNLGVEFLRFDMSEYMEKHAVARLIGAPPGYVGFEQGGLLTERIRKTPHCVLLMDEIEKAHPDLINILLQVMDHGTLTDNNGKKADFRNVVILMSSNAGAREMSTKTIGFGSPKDEIEGKGRSAVERIFSPEFRNRLDAIITFKALSEKVMEMIVDKFIVEMKGQLSDRKVNLKLTPKARHWLAVKGYNPDYGARPLGRLIQTSIKDLLADELLFGRLSRGGTVTIGLRQDALTFSFA
ncbi:ATP-dependent Clp protease ATP-binding subunit ClpA [Desulfoluna sp.]|uniref:ATP-dependent Clp protease ATP-binding subunit ClpA n=1 Tax=Desulfoluna sp. TaxID=2045199 RepID=UPI002621AFCE|nr:ATP-dependent Clp protease ATP-binding subunit ClpA [Desulfoluna sp.]